MAWYMDVHLRSGNTRRIEISDDEQAAQKALEALTTQISANHGWVTVAEKLTVNTGEIESVSIHESV
jgi:hypothetical protein